MSGSVFAGGETVEDLKAQIATLTAELEAYRAEEALIEHNLSLMTMADVSMNARDWKGFNSVHSHDVWVKSSDAPVTTTDRDTHLAVVQSFVNAFPDHKIEQPYVAFIGQGDKVCAVHQNGGTFTQPWHLPGTDIVIPPNGKNYTMKMVTIAMAKGDKLIEEQIFYDMADMAQQLGLSQ
ncbi:ester cyclase [Shimia gijangensis]|uniref:ester cyclase n=1 Tax=Shimia gijangensis TaxID=1470563 RepID=UPI0009322E9E|nr:ester cyclase [Shimia gijangensis]